MTTLYSNNFDAETVGTLPTGWTNIGSTNWLVDTSGPVSAPNALRTAPVSGGLVLYEGVQTADGTVSLTQKYAGNTTVTGVMFRMDAAGQNGYFIGSSPGTTTTNTQVSLFKVVGGTYTKIGASTNITTGFVYATNDLWSIEVSFVGSTIQYRVWDITKGETRPSTANASFTDSTFLSAGYGGARCGGTATPYYGFDDFVISDNNVAATAITLTGPTSGAVGSPSSNFTVGANGTITGTVVVTPSDGGAGGTFSPTTVSINTATPTATFTYTPATTGAKTISTTNNGSLTNPSSITYTASSSTATAVTLTGPTSGAVGAASSAFTVGANGVITGSVVVTPNDSSGGGTFSPTSVTISSGTPTGTFTYTPASSGAKTVAVTNNGSLTNPSAITYTASSGPVTIDRLNAALFYAPYVWHDDGTSMNANSTGSYCKFRFTGTSLQVNFGALSTLTYWPVVRFYIDNTPAIDIQLASGTTNYSVVTGLAAGTHTCRMVVKGISEETSNAWTLVNAVKLLSFVIDASATVSAPATTRPKRMIFFGDSITQGIRVMGTTPVYPTGQDGTLSACPIIAEALQAEFGQVGYGGQGFINTGSGSQPGMNTAYASYSSGVSRLVAGLFSPAPDYVFCNHGTNGAPMAQSDVTAGLQALRAAAPSAWLIQIMPVGGFSRTAITAAVTALINAGDTKLKLVDLGSGDYQTGLNASGNGMTSTGPATETSADTLHPWARTNARLAAEMIRQIQLATEGRTFSVVNA